MRCGRGTACVREQRARRRRGRRLACSAPVAETPRVPQREAGRVAQRGIPSRAPRRDARWRDRGVQVATRLLDEPPRPPATDRVCSSNAVGDRREPANGALRRRPHRWSGRGIPGTVCLLALRMGRASARGTLRPGEKTKCSLPLSIVFRVSPATVLTIRPCGSWSWTRRAWLVAAAIHHALHP